MIDSVCDQHAAKPPREQPAFRDGQVLRAEDLRREDQYRHQAMREHQAQVHSAGIVSGLWLQRDGKRIRITPGMAVDGKGRTILVSNEETIPTCALAEVWIAFQESPADGDDPNTPEGAPSRYVPGYEILIREAGICREETLDAVYLGTVYDLGVKIDSIPNTNANAAAAEAVVIREGQGQNEFPDGVLRSGRRYVRAVGGRVEAASRTSRLLLGPEKPLDPRLFAISTREHANQPYVDHLTVEAGGILHLHSPSLMDLRFHDAESKPASLGLGYHHLEFRNSDILAPNHLAARLLTLSDHLIQPLFKLEGAAKKIAEEFVQRPSLSECECDAIAKILCQWLNGLIAKAGRNSQESTQFFHMAFDERNSLELREETRSLLLAQHGESFQKQPALLMRHLLEDLFYPLLPRTDGKMRTNRVLEFRGGEPAGKAPRPNEFYLSQIETDDGSHEELRLEIHHPGKENNPERFKAVVRTPKEVPPAEEDSPIPNPLLPFCLSVDASRTVTVTCLKVFPSRCAVRSHIPKPKSEFCGFGRGLILKIEAEKDEADKASAAADDLSLVAPWDLVMSEISLTKMAEGKFQLKLKLKNTGNAEMVGIQLHVLIFSTDSPEADPIRETVLRDLALPAGEIADYHTAPLEISYGASGIVNENLNAHLLALGAGPGGTVAEEKRTVPVS